MAKPVKKSKRTKSSPGNKMQTKVAGWVLLSREEEVVCGPRRSPGPSPYHVRAPHVVPNRLANPSDVGGSGCTIGRVETVPTKAAVIEAPGFRFDHGSSRRCFRPTSPYWFRAKYPAR